jgi:methanethiol S-methyltransferase
LGWAPLIVLLAVFSYGLLHSLLASFLFKRGAERLIPGSSRYYRLVYNLFAVLTFLPVLAVLAVLPDRPIYRIPFPLIPITVGLQLAALAFLAAGIYQTGTASFLGIDQLLPISRKLGKDTLVTAGLYRWVRHPLYTAGLVFMWLTPVMTANLLALYMGLSIYLVVGALVEERKLAHQFGQTYQLYRQNTPMFFPNIKAVFGRRELSRR